MSTILAFDTALAGCAVAAVDTETGACAKEVRPMERGQAEALVPMIQAVLEESGHVFSDIDLIATTVGPGAFTGLRIGLATARALGTALGRPVAGATTFEVIARHYHESRQPELGMQVAVLLETKRKDYYFQLFDAAVKTLTEPTACSGEEIEKTLEGESAVFIGDALTRFQREGYAQGRRWQFVEGFELIDPAVLAAVAAENKSTESWNAPEPVYLRAADVSMPKRSPRTVIE